MNNRKQVIIVFGLLCFYSLAIALGFVLGCQKTPSQNLSEPKNISVQVEPKVDKKMIKKQINKLTSEEFAGRRAGTQGEAEAALYLAQQLKNFGIKPKGDNETYFQTFIVPQTDLKLDAKRAEFFITGGTEQLLADNVLGVLESKKRPHEFILLSAHFDHLGIWKNKFYPGANDNASGVAAVLEIMRSLKDYQEDLPYSILVAFWSGEEMGLLGSNYFINHPTVDLTNIKMAINLDSIGAGPKNDFTLWNEGPQEAINKLKTELNTWENMDFYFQYSTQNTSDHKAIAKAQIPAVTILASNWLDGNHTPLDTSILLNYNKITVLAQKVVNLLSSSSIVELVK